MRYIAIGLAFGVAWAAIQLLRGEMTAPVQLAVPIVLCGAFGAALWGVRALILRLTRRSRSVR